MNIATCIACSIIGGIATGTIMIAFMLVCVSLIQVKKKEQNND